MIALLAFGAAALIPLAGLFLVLALLVGLGSLAERTLGVVPFQTIDNREAAQ